MSYTAGFRILTAILMAALPASGTPAFRLLQQNGSLNQQPPSQSQPQQKSAPLPAQERDAVVGINTQLVQIDAVVTDENGRHTDDLTVDDFELLVDGKPQTISHFTLIRLPDVKREALINPKDKPKDGVVRLQGRLEEVTN